MDPSLLKKVEKLKSSVKLLIDSKEIKADIVLVAVGVTGNINNIGLEKLSIKTDKYPGENFIFTLLSDRLTF